MSISRALRWPGQAEAERSHRPRAGRDVGSRSIAAVLATVGVAALWIICHPYAGVIGDARLYLGRDLANLHPSVLGRDLAFANDGQSRFSIFQALTTPLVAWLGVPRAGLIVALCATLSTFVAALAFARAFIRCLAGHHALGSTIAADRLVLPTIIVLAVIPTAYGDPGVFSFFEASAIPRPFAEAAVVGALASILDARWARAGVLLALSFLLHPLMAMAGGVVAILFAIMRFEEWRSHRRTIAVLLMIVFALSLTTAGLAAAGFAPFSLASARIDQAWWDLLTQRSPHLFPTLWTEGAFVRLIAQTATVVIAAHVIAGRAGRLLIAIAAASLGQLVIAALLSDVLHLQLATEVQLWRGTWLLAFVSGCMLVPCAALLWREDAAGRLTLLLLSLLWLVQASLISTVIVAAFALCLRSGRARTAIRKKHVAITAVCVALFATLWNAGVYVGYVQFLNAWSSRLGVHALEIVGNNLEFLPVLVALAGWALLGARRIADPLLVGSTMVLALAASIVWDQRTPYIDASERSVAPPGFDRMAAGRPNEVLWLGGVAEPWFMLQRPQYFSPQQAVGIVFSRPLAMEWRRRADTLIRFGLAHADVFTPWKLLSENDRLQPDLDALTSFCRRKDAPGVIVVPLRDGVALATPADAVTWSAPVDNWVAERRPTTEWHHVSGWMALPCAPKAGENTQSSAQHASR